MTDLGNGIDIENISGRGGRNPGAGRPRKDGSPNVSVQRMLREQMADASLDDLLGLPVEDEGETFDDAPGDDMGAGYGGGVSLVMPADAKGLYAGARARKEAAIAAKAELDYFVKSGQYVPREAVRAAVSVLQQTVAQNLRSIPDNLERKLGISPEVAEEIGILIEDTMADLHSELEKVYEKAYEFSDKG